MAYLLDSYKDTDMAYLHQMHREIIVQLGYNSGHIANTFFPLFYPYSFEYPAPFHLMWPIINNQSILDLLWFVVHRQNFAPLQLSSLALVEM